MKILTYSYSYSYTDFILYNCIKREVGDVVVSSSKAIFTFSFSVSVISDNIFFPDKENFLLTIGKNLHNDSHIFTLYLAK